MAEGGQEGRREELSEMAAVLRERMISPGTPASAIKGLVQELKRTNQELEGIGGAVLDPLDRLNVARARRAAEDATGS